MGYTYYEPLNVWLDPASIPDVVAHIQEYLTEYPLINQSDIEQIVVDYITAHPELVGGVDSVNGKTGEVVLTASDINTSNNTTIQAVLTALSGQISEIVQTITGLDTRVTANATGITNEATVRANADTALGNRITALQGAVGSPLVAATAAAMTDTSKIYVYTGSETGYTNGNWYYYNGSAWTSGGVYNATAINTDTTLTVAGMAADAKATGDGLNDLKSAFGDTSPNLHNPSTDSIGTVSADGSFNPNSTTWKTTDYIFVGVGNTFSCTAASAYFGTDGFTQLAYYDINKSFITRGSSVNSSGTFTHRMAGQQAYVRLMFNINTSEEYTMVNIGDTLQDYTPYGSLILSNSMNKSIIKAVETKGLSTLYLTVASDGSGDFSSLRGAVDYISSATEYEASVIYIKKGVYDIASYYTAEEMSASGFVGLKLPVNCSLIGVDDEESTILTMTFENANSLISTLNLTSNNTVKNIRIEGIKTRYAVHDDFGYTFKNDNRLIENCHIVGTDCYYSNAYGAGNTRNGAKWIFRNCIFEGNGAPFSLHQGTGTVTANNYVTFENCRFINSKTNTPKYSCVLRSLSTPMGDHITYATFKGCAGNCQLILSEENATVYGAGLRYRVMGYATQFTDGVAYQRSDGIDYSSWVNII